MSDRTSKKTRSRRDLKKKGVEVGMRVVSKVMEDPERVKTVIDVVSKVQRGRERVGDATHRMLNASHLPSREDVDRISRHIGALRREVRRLKTRIEAVRRKLESS